MLAVVHDQQRVGRGEQLDEPADGVRDGPTSASQAALTSMPRLSVSRIARGTAAGSVTGASSMSHAPPSVPACSRAAATLANRSSRRRPGRRA
jgi:hypothetical protein